MAAGSTRPRGVQQSKSPRKRSKTQHSWWRSLARPEVIGVAVAALAIALIPFVVDLGETLSGIRDGVARTFGLGIFLLAGGIAALGLAIARRSYQDRARFARKTAGWGAALLFAWGALALNEAEWTLGSVEFAEVSLGGELGQWLFGGFLGLLLWILLPVLAVSLLAPRFSMMVATNAPAWIETAWERRWPHKVANGVWRFLVYLIQIPRIPRREPEPVIDASVAGAIAYRHSPNDSYEDVTATGIRPNIDPAQPRSPVGSGAAAQFATAEAPPIPPPPTKGNAAPETVEPAEDEPQEADDSAPGGDAEGDEAHQMRLAFEEKNGWQLPPPDLLSEPQENSNRTHDNAARAQLIVDTLASFGVDATVVEINEGPTVTQFGVEPGWEVKYKDVPLKDASGKTLVGEDGRQRTERVETGRTRVRVNKITALQNDLALALAAPSLRIEAPVPGRAIVGIEVPNDSASIVSMRSVLETKDYRDLATKSKLALALGRGVAGKPIVADLAKMPHLLIAGATGAGKSVCINSIITAIMTNATPDHVRFVMVDPKRVELTGFKGIPHLAFSEVIVDVDKVVGTLQAVISEMEARYKKFAELGVRNIEGYNRHPRVLKRMPYWVVIIDELADLMMAAPIEVEKHICRLAQLARATGIHLVVATQRPSVDVITGLIKANFPTRIAFAVTSQTDSRTILDQGGAEKLLGRGDMLFQSTDASKPVRIQGVYLADAEVERLVEWWKDERFSTLVPEKADDLLEQALLEQNGGDDDMEVDEDDPLMEGARELASQHSRISPSMLQRRLNIGHVKACRLVDALEDEGIVGPREEGESRRVMERTGSEGHLLD